MAPFDLLNETFFQYVTWKNYCKSCCIFV